MRKKVDRPFSTMPVEPPAPDGLLDRRPPVAPLRCGDLCPACGAGRMDYDGLLELRCERCSYAQGGGCFT